jgi:hypothetical protein
MLCEARICSISVEPERQAEHENRRRVVKAPAGTFGKERLGAHAPLFACICLENLGNVAIARAVQGVSLHVSGPRTGIVALIL